MTRICIVCAIKLIKPIEHDEVALAMFDQSYSIVTSDKTCEMKRCISRADKLTKDVLDVIKAL